MSNIKVVSIFLLFFANVQSQGETTDDDDVNLLDTLAGSEEAQNDIDVNALEILGIVSKLTSPTIPRISHNWLVLKS